MTKTLGPEYKNQSLSHGTMITEDIYEAVKHLLKPSHRKEWDTDYDEAGREYLMNETFHDYLNEIAPVGCYFGSHPGDGSDIGFWEHDDCLQADKEAGENDDD